MRNAVIGSVAYFVLLLVPHLIYPRGMGFGDVKLALLMGLYLGWIYPDPFRSGRLIMWALVLGSGSGPGRRRLRPHPGPPGRVPLRPRPRPRLPPRRPFSDALVG